MAKIIGNHGPYQKGGNFQIAGNGIANVGPIKGGWVQVVGQTGDVVPVTADALAALTLYFGVYVQSSAAASIIYSMDNIALAGNNDPNVRAAATWTAAQTLTAGTIVATTAPLWTVAQVTFTAAGTVTFYAR
jgi:choline-glycine betaine transporter